MCWKRNSAWIAKPINNIEQNTGRKIDIPRTDYNLHIFVLIIERYNGSATKDFSNHTNNIVRFNWEKLNYRWTISMHSN